jgi:nitrite reductase/ring-hydroxylating ferredoxin subunit
MQVSPPGFDTQFAVYRLDGQYYASDDMCTHGMVSLAGGDVVGEEIICPLHGGAFNIRTGGATELPCRTPLKVYEVHVDGEDLFADLSFSQSSCSSAVTLRPLTKT